MEDSSGRRGGRPRDDSTLGRRRGRELLLFVGENPAAARRVQIRPRHKAEERVCGIPSHTHKQNQKENKLKVKSKRKPQREIHSYLKEGSYRRLFKVAISRRLSTEGCASSRVEFCILMDGLRSKQPGSGEGHLLNESAGILRHHQKLRCLGFSF